MSIICRIIIFILLVKTDILSQQLTSAAILSLEKQVMEAGTEKEKAFLLLEKAREYRKLHEYETSLLSIQRIGSPDSSRISALIIEEKIYNLMLLHRYSEALLEWKTLESYAMDTVVTLEVRKYVLPILLLENEEWSVFARIINDIANRKGIPLDSSSLLVFRTPEYKDPSYFRRLSSRLPGLGLIKAGHRGKGIVSLSLNIVSLAFAGLNFYQGFYVTGVVSGVYPWTKFYTGGKFLSERMVEQDNLSRHLILKRKGYQLLDKIL